MVESDLAPDGRLRLKQYVGTTMGATIARDAAQALCSMHPGPAARPVEWVGAALRS